MNGTDDVTFIRDSKSVSLKTKLKLLAGITGILVIAGIGWYVLNLGQPNEGEELISIGLDGELPLDLNPYGYMYLSGFIPEQGVNTFALNLETNTLEEVTTSGNNSEFAPFDGSHALFSTVSNAESGQTEIVIADFSNDTYLQIPTPPGYYKRNIQGFAGEHDGIAYSNRTETASEDDVFF